MTRVMDNNVEALLVAYHRDGDERAREQALVELMPLVRALASRYAGRGEPLEDLVQVGSIGLIKAVDRFDVDRGVDFASYAVPTIVELAKAAGVEEEEAIDALDSMNAYSTRSLHAPFDDESDDSLSEKLGVDESGYAEVEDGT